MNKYQELIEQGYKPEDLINKCTLRVVFVDDYVIDFPNVRYLAAHPSLGLSNPIQVDGTTVTFEDDEQSHTVVGVRHFMMIF